MLPAFARAGNLLAQARHPRRRAQPDAPAPRHSSLEPAQPGAVSPTGCREPIVCLVTYTPAVYL